MFTIPKNVSFILINATRWVVLEMMLRIENIHGDTMLMSYLNCIMRSIPEISGITEITFENITGSTKCLNLH